MDCENLLLGSACTVWRDNRVRCDCCSVHLGISCDVPSEEAVFFHRTQRSHATLGCRYRPELDGYAGSCFARRRVVYSVDSAVGRRVSIQEFTHLFYVRCNPGNASDPINHPALVDAMAQASKTKARTGEMKQSLALHWLRQCCESSTRRNKRLNFLRRLSRIVRPALERRARHCRAISSQPPSRRCSTKNRY